VICRIKWYPKLLLLIIFITGSFEAGLAKVNAVDSTKSLPQQVYLTFQYEGGVNTVVLAYYWNKKFYLPVNSLFGILRINHSYDLSRKTISGYYLDKSNHYKIDLQNQTAISGSRRIEIQHNDYLIKKLDYYLSPDLYKELFDLNFTVNFNKLRLTLTTSDELPSVRLYQQEQKRNSIVHKPYLIQNYPIQFHEKRHVLNGGFIDYDINSSYSGTNNSVNVNLHGGGEVLGGDLQGNFFGAYTNKGYGLEANNIRWRYVFRKSPYLKSIIVGKIQSDNIYNIPIHGVHVSNEPVTPRYIYGKYSLDGTTDPSSIVELYMDNQLIQFQKTNDLGRYHFSIPLSYGSSNLHMKIYGPNGNVTDWNKLIRIPYDFIPKHKLNYNIRVGETPSYSSLNYINKKVVQTNIKYGVSNWLSAKMGLDYLNANYNSKPLPYGSLNARIATEYLISADIIPNDFYQMRAEVTYPNLASWNLRYVKYNGYGGYNTQQAKQLIDATLFVPTHIANIPISLQANGSQKKYLSYQIYNYNLSLNANLHPFNITENYSSYWITSSLKSNNQFRKLTSAISTNLIGHIFMRGQIDYYINSKRIQNWSVIMSRKVSHWGYLSLNYRRNVQSNYGFLGISIRFNLNKLHAYLSVQGYNNSVNVSQSLNGSIGYDNNYHKLFFDNLNEVGTSDATFRLFVDSNNNDHYDHGEKVLKDDAVRLIRTEQWRNSKSGIKTFIHLLPYRRYNAEILESQISNPLLVPKFDKFSFVTDPNSFKKIDIPFYSTGVISGSVSSVNKKNKKEPISGLKVILRKNNGNIVKQMRTYSDGSFYSMHIRPGKYEVYIDSTQVQFLNSISKPGIRHFSVKAMSKGDFVDSLNFTLKPRPKSQSNNLTIPDTVKGLEENMKGITANNFSMSRINRNTSTEKNSYFVQIGAFKNLDLALHAQSVGESSLDQEFLIRYLPDKQLFKVYSGCLPDSVKSELLLDKLKKSTFKGAYINNGCLPSPSSLKFSIQFGAFSIKKHAEKFSSEIAGKLHIKMVVTQDTSPGYFYVRMKPVNSWIKAWKVRQKALKSGYSKAFVVTSPSVVWLSNNYYYRVELGAFKNHSNAINYAYKIHKKLHIPTIIQQNKDHLYLVLANQNFTWEQAHSLQLEVKQEKGLITPWIYMLNK